MMHRAWDTLKRMRYSGGAELLMTLLALVDHRKVPKHPFASSSTNKSGQPSRGRPPCSDRFWLLSRWRPLFQATCWVAFLLPNSLMVPMTRSRGPILFDVQGMMDWFQPIKAIFVY